MYKKVKETSVRDTMEKYPRITAHIIAESLGYATPSCAAKILKDAREGHENYLEWIFSCYERDPFRAVNDSIKRRHFHKGFMSDYKKAYALVRQVINEGIEHLFGSWF